VIPTALWLLAIQGAIGAFDTLYYHEWRARLPARGSVAWAGARAGRPLRRRPPSPAAATSSRDLRA